MSIPSTIAEYLRRSSQELGERILKIYPALQAPDDPVSERFNGLLRSPFAAQRLAVMGIVKRWEQARAAAVIAECGTGKTLMALSALHVHSAGRPYAALVMAPPNIVGKWCREILITIPGARVFMIDGLRTPTRSGAGPYGVNEVRYRNGRIVREGLHTTLTDLRLRKSSKSARDRWQKLCPGPSFWVVGRDRAKLSYFWRHAYSVAESGPYLGSAVNADSGAPLIVNDERVLATEFEKIRRSEILGGPDGGSGKDRRSIYSPLWQADGKRIRRFAPLEFVGRYMKDFFDYGIADEVHELSNDTAQGNALGTLARAVDKIAVLTGTLMGGYADDLFNVLYRLEPHKMVAEGYEWGEPGVRSFAETYGVLERVTIIAPEENACSKAKVTKQVKRKPGASPLLFGKFLMELGAFVSLEDISSELPSYREEVIGVDMDEPLAKAYTDLEEQIKEALEEHRGNHSVISTALNALLSYPDRPYGLGDLIGTEYDPELHRRVPFLIAKTQDLARGFALREGAEADRMHQGRSCPRQKMPDLCRVHGETGRHQPARTGSVAGRHPRFGAHESGAPRSAGGVVRTQAPRRYASVRGSSSPGFRGHGLAVGAINLLRADGILDLHFATGKPPILANRSTVERGRPIPDLQRHDADVVSSSDGQEAPGFTGHGGQIFQRGPAGYRGR